MADVYSNHKGHCMKVRKLLKALAVAAGACLLQGVAGHAIAAAGEPVSKEYHVPSTFTGDLQKIVVRLGDN